MIREVTGDILKSKAKAIVHGVAPGDHFNQGLALSLREHWPAMAKDFRHYCHQTHPKPGSAWVWMSAEGTKIVNLMTQPGAEGHNSHPGKARLDYVDHALKELRTIIEKENIPSIALPKIATGVGGLEWNDVYPLIEKHLGSLKNSKVFIYSQYQKGLEAVEQ